MVGMYSMRHGIGTATYADGSTYEGDWFRNVRHGNGVFKLLNDKGEHMTYHG